MLEFPKFDNTDCHVQAITDRIWARREAGHPQIALYPLHEPVEPRPNWKRVVVALVIFGGVLWLRFGR